MMTIFHMLKYVSIVVIVIYVIGLLLLFVFQKKLIFFPEKLAPDFKFATLPGDQEITITTKDRETISAIFFRGTGNDVILYFHGNAGSLNGWRHVAPDFTRHGYSILIIDYRGYGKSSGVISESGFYLDAEAAYQWLLQNYEPEQIIVYGRSIGSGVATHLASRRACKGLILESAYTSLTTLASQKLPLAMPGLLLTTRFSSIEKLSSIKAPVILIHGGQDELIPKEHSRKLLEKITTKKKLFILADAAHNDLNAFEEYHKIIGTTVPQFFSNNED